MSEARVTDAGVQVSVLYGCGCREQLKGGHKKS